MSKTLTIAFMEPPFESGRGALVFRLIAEALDRGFHLNVFAYEGAVYMPFARQQPHANAVHGRETAEENHPLPKDWVTALFRRAEAAGLKLNWVNCGLCVDERGAGETVDGVRRGSPADFWKMAVESNGALVIGAR